MQEWVEIASKNGLAIAVLFALAAFIYKKLWPRFERSLDDADARDKENQRRWEEHRKENLDRWEMQGKLFIEALKNEREDNAQRFDEQGKRFMEALRTQNVLAAETHRESMKSQNEITKELRALTHQLKNGNGKS